MFEINKSEPIKLSEKGVSVNPFNLSSVIGEEKEETDLVSLAEENSEE